MSAVGEEEQLAISFDAPWDRALFLITAKNQRKVSFQNKMTETEGPGEEHARGAWKSSRRAHHRLRRLQPDTRLAKHKLPQLHPIAGGFQSGFKLYWQKGSSRRSRPKTSSQKLQLKAWLVFTSTLLCRHTLCTLYFVKNMTQIHVCPCLDSLNSMAGNPAHCFTKGSFQKAKAGKQRVKQR